MATVSLHALRDAMNDVDFPVHKDTLVLHAEQHNHSAAVQKALRTLPPVDYRSADEVIRSVTVDVGSGEPASQHADPEHGTDKPGVADHLR